MANSVNKSTLAEACIEMFKAIEGGKKVEMALELLYTTEPNAIQPPEYISEGLEWLKDKLGLRSKDFIEVEVRHD